MIIAIPTANGKLSPHFGHVREFTFVTVEDGKIVGKEIAIPPPHEPGVLPQWVHSKGATLVIAGGMGRRAMAIFEDLGIKVICGAEIKEPEKIVEDFIQGKLETGRNLCDH